MNVSAINVSIKQNNKREGITKKLESKHMLILANAEDSFSKSKIAFGTMGPSSNLEEYVVHALLHRYKKNKNLATLINSFEKTDLENAENLKSLRRLTEINSLDKVHEALFKAIKKHDSKEALDFLYFKENKYVPGLSLVNGFKDVVPHISDKFVKLVGEIGEQKHIDALTSIKRPEARELVRQKGSEDAKKIVHRQEKKEHKKYRKSKIQAEENKIANDYISTSEPKPKQSFFDKFTDDFFETMDKSNVTQHLDKLDGEAGAGAGVGIVIDTVVTAPIVATKSLIKTAIKSVND